MPSDELIGRDVALAVLSSASQADDVQDRALLLTGERGIGKTACVLAGRAIARATGNLVVDTAGSVAETALPYAGLHRLLRPVLRRMHNLPEVQRRALSAALGMHEGRSDDALVVCVATLNLLRDAAGERGFLLTADDLQWLDAPTLVVIAFVARRLERHEVVIAASSAMRPAPALGDTFREVHLDRLGESDAHRLLSRRSADLTRAQRKWVIEQAVGNPLALLELAKTAAAAGVVDRDLGETPWALTAPLERAFATGVENWLPGPARDALLVAAVASEARVQEIVAATAALQGRGVDTAVLDVAQERGLLSFDEIWVRFAHPLVKSAIVQRESVSRRQSAHRALGSVITLSSHRRAWHRAQGTAHHDDAVAAELEATTPDSIRRGDTAAAIKALERAAELSSASAQRGRRLLLAARHAARVGQPDVVRRLLGAAVVGTLSDSDRLRADLLGETFDGVVIADSSRVTRLCTDARRAMTAGDTDLALELAEAAVRRRCAAPVDALAVAQLKSLAADLAATSTAARTVTVLALADPVDNGRGVLSAVADVDIDELDADGLSAFGVAARAVGHYSAASVFFDRAEVALRAQGLLTPLAENLSVVADLRVELGEWDRAAAALIGFEALSAAAMSPSHRASALTTAAKIAALRGDVSTALSLVADAECSPAARSGSRFLARATIVRAIACISAGRHDDAYAVLSRVFDPADPSHHFREQFDAVAHLAETAAHTGRHGEVRDVIERIRPFAAVSGSPSLGTQLGYADAVLATDERAEDLFAAALGGDSGGSTWQRARLQLAYGRWLRRGHRVTQSRAPLQASWLVLHRLGATTWAAEALDELRAAGVHPTGRAGRSGPEALSAQEVTIARLAAQGLSNKQIGQQLYLSPRTVGSHLYRVFPKLGISTRAQIAARLADVVGAAADAPTV